MGEKQIDEELDEAGKVFGDGVWAIGKRVTGFNDEFMEFLKRYQVIGLAVAVVIGTAATKLVNYTVTDIVMPIVAVVIPSGRWQTAVLEIGPLKFLVGEYLSAVIDFGIIALVIFLAVKYLMKGEMGKKI
jgi:large conductance mechanosensitive channel